MPASSSSQSGTIHLDSVPPALGRRGPLSHPAVLLLAAGIVLFAAYALGYIPEVGSLIEGAIRSSRSAPLPALSPAIYGIGGLVAFLLLLAVLRSFDLLLQRFRKTIPLTNRPLKPLNEFIEEAAVGEISLRVAREGYNLLQPYYPRLMCIALTDDLRVDLGLTEDQIRVVVAKLLLCCDRRENSAAVAEALNLTSVFDLLRHVETAGPLRLERPSGLRERNTDTASEPPATQPLIQYRNPSSAQRKAIHAAALHAIESRSLRKAPPSGLSRRNSDYEGPRRRATDTCTEPNHKGPFRRSTDRPVAESAATPVESEAGPSLDPRKLNRVDLAFVPPIGQRHVDSAPQASPAPSRPVLTSDRPY